MSLRERIVHVPIRLTCRVGDLYLLFIGGDLPGERTKRYHGEFTLIEDQNNTPAPWSTENVVQLGLEVVP